MLLFFFAHICRDVYQKCEDAIRLAIASINNLIIFMPLLTN